MKRSEEPAVCPLWASEQAKFEHRSYIMLERVAKHRYAPRAQNGGVRL